MKTAFIETSAINFCFNKNISAKEFTILMEKEGLLPVIGNYTTYELARTFNNNPYKTKVLFNFVSQINPMFSCLRDELYKMERRKLIFNTPVDHVIKSPFLQNLHQRIEDYSNGSPNEELEKFIRSRQAFLNSMRSSKKPTGLQRMYRGYKSFNEFLIDILKDLETNNVKIEALNLLLNTINISLKRAYLLKFINELNSYPALRAFFYNHLYLQYLTEYNNAILKEGTFTDGLQVIESSYCDTFISHDKHLLNHQAKYLNPDLELRDIENL